MLDSTAAGFWSYAHEDNEADAGGILELAARLKAEFSLLTGESLRLFVDRDDLQWGDEWHGRIDDALIQTTFFIPIITPRYFKREECRRELITFAGQARSLGVSELVLPILYGEVADLTADNEDEAISLIARMQYTDWTALRLAGASSPEYRSALNVLGKRLVEIAALVSTRQVQRELREAREGPSADDADLSSLLQQIDVLLPEWLEAVRADPTINAQHEATDRVHAERLRKLDRSGAPASARFVELQRYAAEELPLAERLLQLSRIYLAKTIELDPLVAGVLRIVEKHPDLIPVLKDLSSAVDDAVENISSGNLRRERAEGLGILSMAEYGRRNAHISRTMRQMGQAYELQPGLVKEANAIVLGWHEKLIALSGAVGLEKERST